MLIRITPENEFEKQRMNEGSEHAGVKEFFMFGNKKDKDGDLIDFHDWSGSYRYLEGSLYYFLTTVTEEKKIKAQRTPEIPFNPQAQSKTPFLKRGQLDDSNMKLVDVQELAAKMDEQAAKTVQFPSGAPADDENPSNNDDK